VSARLAQWVERSTRGPGFEFWFGDQWIYSRADTGQLSILPTWDGKWVPA